MLSIIWHGRLRGVRVVLACAVAGLLLIGLVSIGVTTSGAGFTQRHLVWIGLGLLVFVGVNVVPYRTWGRFSYLLYGLALGLLVFVLVGKHLGLHGFVEVKYGAARWIKLIPYHGSSPTVQPSEVAKVAYIAALAWYLRQRRSYRTLGGLIGPFALALVPMALIVLEPDLGTTLLFLPVLFAVLFAAGARLKHLVVVIGLGVVFMPVFYFFLMEDYQRTRVRVLLRQDSDDVEWLRGPGYQLYKSKVSIGSGGLMGEGLGLDEESAEPPPFYYNDFIFAMIAHQWGFVGVVVLAFFFVLLLLSAIEIAAEQPEPFGRLIAVGVAALLGAQACVNMGMTMGLMPVTGMTLPFVSYGGSSMVVNFLALGLLFNVARHRSHRLTVRPFEFGRGGE